MTIPSQAFFLVENRWVRATLTDMGPQNIVAQRLAASAFNRLPSVWPDRTLVTKDNVCYLGQRLRTLRLDTNWSLVDGVFIPTFSSNGTGHLRLTPIFTFPDTVQVYFGLSAKQEGTQWTFTGSQCFAKLETATYILPLPNIYNDSNVCMGSGYHRTAPTLTELGDRVLADFTASPWNTDLLEAARIPKAQSIFKCNADGEPLPITTITADQLIRAVHPQMEYYV